MIHNLSLPIFVQKKKQKQKQSWDIPVEASMYRSIYYKCVPGNNYLQIYKLSEIITEFVQASNDNISAQLSKNAVYAFQISCTLLSFTLKDS